jgi:antagonist of KipI
MTRTIFDVLDGGFLTTVQDAGRPDWAHLGVPESGAADPWSFAVANLLAGNDPDAAALELTLIGPTLVARTALTIGLAGADLGARIRGGRRLLPGRSHRLSAGDELDIEGGDEPGAMRDARAYLAVPGGIDVPVVLGSRSTCLAAAFGGLDGRPLAPGDQIGVVDASHGRLVRPELVWPEPDPDPASPPHGDAPEGAPVVLRVLAGPAPGFDALAATAWRVGSAADRVGLRLDGDPLPDGIGGEMTTHGVCRGAIQVPPDGRPIVLGADHQTTGGYRVVGVVISADLAVLGQLRPGAPVRLAATDRPAAIRALRVQHEAVVAGAAALHDAAGWGALIDLAGG